MKGHNDTVKALAFYNERQLLSGSMDMTIKLWDVEKGICQRTFNCPDGPVYSILVIRDKGIYVGSNHCIITYDFASFQQLKVVDAHKSQVNKMILIMRKNEKNLLVSASQDQTLRIWEVDNMNPIRQLEETLPVSSLCYIQEFDYLATGLVGYKGEGRIGIWQLDFFKKINEFSENPSGVYQLIWDSVNKALFSCHENKCIEFNKIQGVVVL